MININFHLNYANGTIIISTNLAQGQEIGKPHNYWIHKNDLWKQLVYNKIRNPYECACGEIRGNIISETSIFKLLITHLTACLFFLIITWGYKENLYIRLLNMC